MIWCGQVELQFVSVGREDAPLDQWKRWPPPHVLPSRSQRQGDAAHSPLGIREGNVQRAKVSRARGNYLANVYRMVTNGVCKAGSVSGIEREASGPSTSCEAAKLGRTGEMSTSPRDAPLHTLVANSADQRRE